MAVRIIMGHVLDALAGLRAGSVHCMVTSPPYYGLRDYGIEPQVWGGAAGCEHEWGTDRLSIANDSNRGSMVWTTGGNPAAKVKGERVSQGAFCLRCGAWRGSLGLEPTLGLYLDHMVEVFRAVRRVLRADGTVFLNVGDSYSAQPGQRKSTDLAGPKQRSNTASVGVGSRSENSLKPKDLMLVPARLAIRLQEDGWWVRSDIAWCKRAPMPESCTDRPTTAWEHVFLLTKSARYFYDAEAEKEECEPAEGGRARAALRGESPYAGADYKDYHEGRTGRHQSYQPPYRNLRNFWLLGPEPFPEAHFATFPTEIPRRAILAGTSAKGCCPKCAAGWVRVVKKRTAGQAWTDHAEDLTVGVRGQRDGIPSGTLRREAWRAAQAEGGTETLGWRPSCGCDAGAPVPATCLDPFLGSGTTALVADRLGRDCIGIELNEAYAAMARRRLAEDAGMFAEVAE